MRIKDHVMKCDHRTPDIHDSELCVCNNKECDWIGCECREVCHRNTDYLAIKRGEIMKECRTTKELVAQVEALVERNRKFTTDLLILNGTLLFMSSTEPITPEQVGFKPLQKGE